MALIALLKVLNRSGKEKTLGTLHMYDKVWEWIGVNSTTDGGTWEWKKENTTGQVRAELTSGTYNRVVTPMFSKEWDKGPLPPHIPWFADPDPYSYMGADDYPNTLEHYGPNRSMKVTAIWMLK